MSTHSDYPAWAAAPRGAAPEARAARHSTAMRLLACGVPLSLIMDLALPGGPRSQEILTVERDPDDAWRESR